MTKPDEKEESINAVNRDLDSRRRAIFTKTDLQEIIIHNLPNVGVNQKTIIRNQILDYLWEKQRLLEVVFDFPSRKETRYIYGDITNFELAQSLKPNAYLAHRAAMFINGLCSDYPETIHINVEQARYHKRNTGSLSQQAIDQAFRNKSRVSNEIAEANGIKVCITHGQRTDQLGVEIKKGSDGELLRVTNVERTLVDITVRPIYAGGPASVIDAYRNASEITSVDELLDVLQKMNFVYPYHQAVGFYLERSNVFTIDQIEPFEKMKKEFDFYLDYRMKNPKYSEKWKIYYPTSL